MKNFVTIKDNIVTNKIVAESLMVAESISKLLCIEIDNDTNVEIGYFYNSETSMFESTRPFNSWIWDTVRMIWSPPFEKPVDDNTYVWNEEILDWSITSSES